MNIYTILPDVILLFFAGVFQSEFETLMRDTGREPWFPNWKWWTGNNWQFKNKLIAWLMKYPLSAFKDGGHWCKSTGVILICIVIANHQVISGNLICDILIYYTIIGTGFNVFYD